VGDKDYFFRNFIVVIAALASVMVLYKASSLIAPLGLALLLSYVWFPVVKFMNAYGIPKGLTIALIFIFILAVVGYSGAVLLPSVRVELSAITAQQSSRIEQTLIFEIVESVSAQLFQYRLIKEEIDAIEFISNIRTELGKQSSLLLNSIGSVAAQAGQFLLIFLFVFTFALLDGDRFYKTIIGFIPNSVLEPGLLMLRRTTVLFGAYVRGLVIENSIVCLITLLMMALLKLFVPLSLTLCVIVAIVIGLTNVVRIIGPLIGGAISVILILASEPNIIAVAGVVAIAFLVQLIDNVLLLPLIMKEEVDVHPVIGILSILAGGMIAGVLGMIIAIPLAGAIKIIFNTSTVELKKFQVQG